MPATELPAAVEGFATIGIERRPERPAGVVVVVEAGSGGDQ